MLSDSNNNVIVKAMWDSNPVVRAWFDYDFRLFKFFIENKAYMKSLLNARAQKGS